MPVRTRRAKSGGAFEAQQTSAHRIFDIPHLLHEIFSTLASDSTPRIHLTRYHRARDEFMPAWALPFEVDRMNRHTCKSSKGLQEILVPCTGRALESNGFDHSAVVDSAWFTASSDYVSVRETLRLLIFFSIVK